MKLGLSASLLTALFFFSLPVFSQRAEDSSFFKTAVANTIAIYNHQLEDQSSILNGSRYSPTGFVYRKGSAYFFTESFAPGFVVYDHIRFDSLQVLYEDLRDMLIVKIDNYLFQLVNQRVDSFTLSGHPFARYVADSTNRGIPKTGFYEILYAGRSTALRRTVKYVTEEANVTEGVLRDIFQTDFYYLKINGEYKHVKSRSELLDFMGDHKKDVQRFMKKNKLKFKRDKQESLVQVAAYYDQIAH